MKFKKVITLTSVLALGVLASFTLASCDEEETHVHEFTGAYLSDATGHYQVCSCGEKGEVSAHTYGEYTVVKAATEDEVGSKSHTCSVCSYVETAEIEKLAHTHVYGEWSVKTAPTKDSEGIISRTCSKDSNEETASLPKLNETDYTVTITKEATCTIKGSKTYKYTKDSQTLDVATLEIDALGHSYGNYVETTKPTTTSKGLLTRTCTRCNDSDTLELPMLNSTDYSYSIKSNTSNKAVYTYTYKVDTQTFDYEVTVDNTYAASTTETLQTLLTNLTGSKSGDNTLEIVSDIDFTGVTWTSINVEGYTGAGIITINGNNHTIKGLTSALIKGGFAGTSGVVINDITLDSVNINDTTETLGLGAFVGCADSMTKITLNNCHLTNSTIVSTGGARVGGLIGWTSGYSKASDGPVKEYVTVSNCSVENTSITADGSVGAIIGHAGSSSYTYQTIENCTISGCTLTSTDNGEWRVGVVVGTANAGELTITNITSTNNTVSQTGKVAPEGEKRDYYGRFSPSTTGTLTIDGVAITA